MFICQRQIKELEEQLENEGLHKEIKSLKQQLELLEEDKKELEGKYQNAEEKVKNLKHSGNILVVSFTFTLLIMGTVDTDLNRVSLKSIKGHSVI